MQHILLHATERSINLQMHDFCHWNKQEHHNKGMQPVLTHNIESSVPRPAVPNQIDLPVRIKQQ
jgi:hypothetical protein